MTSGGGGLKSAEESLGGGWVWVDTKGWRRWGGVQWQRELKTD